MIRSGGLKRSQIGLAEPAVAQPASRGARPAESAVSLLQRLVGNHETARVLSGLGPRADEVARFGMAGPARPLPHREEIQRAFGGHDVGEIPAYVGGAAAEAASAMGTVAYARDGRVAFAQTPDLHMAAHEAAHVIQRRADGPFDRARDEREADAIADRVVRGQSAEDLLPASHFGLAQAPAASPAAVQAYTRVPIGEPYDLLSDDGKLAVKDHSREAWAESTNISRANSILAGKKSKARLEEVSGGSIVVSPPGLTGVGSPPLTLTKFKMKDASTGKELELRDDCGYASQQMLGAEATGPYVDWAFTGVYKGGITERSNYQVDDQMAGGAQSTVEKMSGEIYQRIFEVEKKQKLSRTDALQAWANLSDEEQRTFAEKYGINQYAVPKVGQGITIGTEYDMPGAQASGGRFPFHFGFNVIASGHDYVTVEDYSRSGVKYYFDMYGPAMKGQAWHQDSSNTGALGNKRTTIVVEHSAEFDGKTNAAGAHFVDDPAVYKTDRALEKDTQITVLRKMVNWMKVEVKSGQYAGKRGWILNKYFVGTK